MNRYVKVIKKRIYRLQNRIKSKKAAKLLSKRSFTQADLARFSIWNVRAAKTEKEKLEAAFREICKRNLDALKAREIIRVSFVVYSASMWSCDYLYKLFEQDERFLPNIVVARYNQDSEANGYPMHQKTLEFFQKKGYRIADINERTGPGKCWQAMGMPDVAIYLTPYDTLIPEGLNLKNLPLCVLPIYIAYSYMLSKAESKFNTPGMIWSWKYFCDSNLYREILIKHNADFEKNTVFIGYPKMDRFYEPLTTPVDAIWKIPQGRDAAQMKKIVYAPHHSLKGVHTISSFSTFDENYEAFYELAKATADSITWIIKPHPNLGRTAYESGLFASYEEYRLYLQKWDDLPNARAVEEGDYIDIFKTSDALICDSVSFLAEYQFTAKPLLLLTRPEQQFNEFGSRLKEVLYTVPGGDKDGIAAFIQNVVIGGEDPMAEERKRFFNTHLQYRTEQDPSASEKIYRYLCDSFFN